jgi:hypothetical protein
MKAFENYVRGLGRLDQLMLFLYSPLFSSSMAGLKLLQENLGNGGAGYFWHNLVLCDPVYGGLVLYVYLKSCTHH